MKKDFITGFLGWGDKEKEKNTKKILRTLYLIVGSIFIAEGIMSLFPEGLTKGFLIGMGLILVIFAVLDKN